MADQSNFIEDFIKKNYKESVVLPIICIKINEKYTHHRRLIIGHKYYTKKFTEGSGWCNVFSDEKCETSVGSYWTWMFLCIPLHREQQIDSIFKD